MMTTTTDVPFSRPEAKRRILHCKLALPHIRMVGLTPSSQRPSPTDAACRAGAPAPSTRVFPAPQREAAVSKDPLCPGQKVHETPQLKYIQLLCRQERGFLCPKSQRSLCKMQCAENLFSKTSPPAAFPITTDATTRAESRTSGAPTSAARSELNQGRHRHKQTCL